MYHKRNIAAPFQNKNKIISQVPSNEEKFEVIDGFVNFRNFSFPPLESVHQLKFDKYCGPTPESNWVIPGVLLVGAYPASEDDEDTFELISSILKQGVTKFVCLQSEYQAGVPRHIWISGGALRPYYEDVQHIVSLKDTIPEFRGYKIVDTDNLSFDHCPIIDCGVTDDSKVLSLAMKLVKDISEGEIVYLHCWGGHGRTGTIVCIMLHLLYGMSWKESFEYCQAVHDLRTCPVEVGSPQTQQQRMQVIRVIELLMAEYEDRRVAQETAALQRFHTQLLEQSQQEEGCIHNTTNGSNTAITTAAVTVAAAVVEGTHHSIPSTIHNRTGGAHTTTTSTTASTITSPIKPGIVVRESTQDHITQMHRHNIGKSANIGMSAAQTASMNAYNNKNLGRKKTNIGTGSVENSSLPAIHSNSTNSSIIKTSAQVKNTPTTTSTTTNSTSSTTGIGLLQTLQAHPPRNPPPHNTRSEVLRTRGISPLKQQSANAPYIPQSSDEGENSNTEDDEEGFIISQMTSCASLMGRQRSAIDDQMSLVSDGDSRSGTPGGVSYISSSTSCASRPMSVARDSPSPGVVRNSDSNTSNTDGITTTTAVTTTAVGATATITGGSDNDSVVSEDSMDLSIDGQSADSTTEVLQATTGSGIINQGSSSSSSSTDVQLSAAVKTTNLLTKPDSISTTTPITKITTTATTSITASRDDSTDLDDTVIRPATTTSTTTTAIYHTQTSTVKGRTASADGTTTTTTTTTTSGDTSSSGKKKHKRISSAKAITNAFREGIKMLTGSSSSRSRSNTNNSNTSSTDKKTTAVLKTASTDSTVSCNTSLSISHSNSSTPTNAKHHTTTASTSSAHK